MENLESQEMELMALKNIYDDKDFIVDRMDPPCGRFVVNVRLPKQFYVSSNISEVEETDRFEVEYLPHITLFFEFPDTYPTETCPAFLLTCNWLTLQQLTVLCRKLESLWEESKDAILFTWFQFLENETLNALDISECLDISEILQFGARRLLRSLSNESESEETGLCRSNSVEASADNETREKRDQPLCIKPRSCGGPGVNDVRAFNDLPDRRMLVQLIRNFNQFQKSEVFKTSNHECDICTLSKQGYEFTTFRFCGHTYCNECLRSFFEVQIRDGNVHSLNCPNDSCDTQADGALVKQLVSNKLFEKYDTLLLSSTLESMSDVMYCPRRDCQCPVIIDTCGRMGTCAACSFVFCALCQMAYHGVAPCNFKKEEQKRIYEQYTSGDASVKQEMEKRFGKRAIRHLVEDTMSESWKSSNSKDCPHCKASIEKTDGCNKMTCFKCGIYFCWLCLQHLNSARPYLHFDDQNSECYGQLFPYNELNMQFEVEPGEYLEFL